MAYTGRVPRFDVSADIGWEDSAMDEPNRDWVRQAMAIVAPHTVPGGYVNELAATGPGGVRAIYGDATYTRLQSLKRAWDPDNVFHINHNILP